MTMLITKRFKYAVKRVLIELGILKDDSALSDNSPESDETGDLLQPVEPN